MNFTRDLDRATSIVRVGGVIAYPTEGCYGLGCDPRNTRAITRVLRLKRRGWKPGLILLASDWRQVRCFVDESFQDAVARARATWPGPYTWLLPARRYVSRWIRGEHDEIAIRVTAHPIAADLCRRAGGALISTSANFHGQPPAMSGREAHRLFSSKVDCVLSGASGDSSGPTEIRNALTGVIVRSGSRIPQGPEPFFRPRPA